MKFKLRFTHTVKEYFFYDLEANSKEEAERQAEDMRKEVRGYGPWDQEEDSVSVEVRVDPSEPAAVEPASYKDWALPPAVRKPAEQPAAGTFRVFQYPQFPGRKAIILNVTPTRVPISVSLGLAHQGCLAVTERGNQVIFDFSPNNCEKAKALLLSRKWKEEV